MLQDIGKEGGHLYAKKHPYKIQYHVCNICCVSETTPFVWPAEEKKNGWVCNDGETNQTWEKSDCIYKKSSDILTETEDSLHFTIYVPYGQQQKKKKSSLCVHWLVSLVQAVTTVSHSMFLFPYLVLSPHRSVLYVRSKARSAPG